MPHDPTNDTLQPVRRGENPVGDLTVTVRQLERLLAAALDEVPGVEAGQTRLVEHDEHQADQLVEALPVPRLEDGLGVRGQGAGCRRCRGRRGAVIEVHADVCPGGRTMNYRLRRASLSGLPMARIVWMR